MTNRRWRQVSKDMEAEEAESLRIITTKKIIHVLEVS